MLHILHISHQVIHLNTETQKPLSHCFKSVFHTGHFHFTGFRRALQKNNSFIKQLNFCSSLWKKNKKNSSQPVKLNLCLSQPSSSSEVWHVDGYTRQTRKRNVWKTAFCFPPTTKIALVCVFFNPPPHSHSPSCERRFKMAFLNPSAYLVGTHGWLVSREVGSVMGFLDPSDMEMLSSNTEMG